MRANTSSVDTLIGNRLRTLRAASGLSTKDMAEAAKIPVEEYSLSERGERRLRAHELFRVAAKLNVGMSDVLSVLQRPFVDKCSGF